MPTIHNTLLDPLGAAVEGATVEIRLLVDTTEPLAGGYVNASEATVSWTSRVTTNASGYWEAVVPTGNDDVVPAGSVYEIIELRSGTSAVVHLMDVPTAAGDYWVGDYTATAPDGSSSTLHALGSHSDVDTSAQADGYALAYDSASGKWIASAAAGVPSTSETTAGVIELATQAEVDAEADAVRAVTPATLGAWTGGGGGGGSGDVVGPASATDSAVVLYDGTTGKLVKDSGLALSGSNTGDEAAASATVSGTVELATIAETDTGTDATRAVTPDGLQGSALQTKVDAISGTNTGDEAAASATVSGTVELATQAEVDAEADTARVVTPETLGAWAGNGTPSSASATVEGIVELATQAEVDAEADTTRVVTPETLGAWAGNGSPSAASATVAGVIELATQAEVDAGTDAVRAVTPDTLEAWSGGGGGGGGDLMHTTKSSDDTLDDNFADATNQSGPTNGLDSKWTAVYGSTGTATLAPPSGAVSRYDLSQAGRAVFQTGPNNTDIVMLRQTVTLGDGESVVAACSLAIYDTSASATSYDNLRYTLSVGSSSTSSRSGDYLEVGWEADGNAIDLQSYNGSVAPEIINNRGSLMQDPAYLRILRVGLVYKAHIATAHGRQWQKIGTMTFGAAPGYLFLTLVGDSGSASTGATGMCYWIRQGGSDFDPWVW